MDKEQIKRIPNLLLDIVAADLGPPAHQFNGYAKWACPFHSEREPSFVVYADNGWKCFGSCGESGDVYRYLEKRHNVPFKDALQRVARFAGLGDVSHTPERRAPAAPAVRLVEPPPDDWQQRATLAMIDCGVNLFDDEGNRARRWLNAERGLADDTLRRWWIGYSPGETLHGHWVERGVVIPNLHRGTNTLWALKIRRPVTRGQKYTHVTGGQAMLWGMDNLPNQAVAIVCEGELDGLLLWQHAGDLCAVIAQGPSTNVKIDDWLPHLLHVERVFVATDNDAAGDKAWEKWEKATKRARRALPPLGQRDITDAWRAGADLRAWVRGLLGIAEQGECVNVVNVPLKTGGSEKHSQHSQTCFACGGTKFVPRLADGKPVCTVCHPLE